MSPGKSATTMQPATQKRSIVHRLLPFAHSYRKEILLSLTLSVATTAANIGLMGTSAWLIATAALQPSIAELQVAIVGVRAFGISRGLFRYLERLVSHSANFHLLARIRGWFFRSIEPRVPGAIEDIKAGDLLARSAQDIENLEDFYVRGIAPPLSAVIITLGISLFTLQYGISLAALLAGGLILTGFVLSIQIQFFTRKRSEALVSSRGEMAAVTMDTIRNTAEILMSGAQSRHMGRVRQASAALRMNNLAISHFQSLSLASGVLFSNLTLAAILFYGVQLVQAGRIDGVTLAVLALVTLAGFEPVSQLPSASVRVETSLASAGRLFELTDRPLPVVDEKCIAPIAKPRRLTVTGLDFTYPGANHPALKGINLELHQGEKIALVGPSGSGKTTLFRILQKYLPASVGTVFWDETDLTQIDGYTTRSWQAVIQQKGYLFSGSIRENFRLALPQINDLRIIRAIHDVGLSDWFASLPHALDTWLGDNGKQVSGGERQRLIIARALVMDRTFLLADEPLSNLDVTSERKILKTLFEHSNTVACLIATHRLVSMEDYDEILVLENGQIIQRGCHNELVKQTGLYKQMWDRQNDSYRTS